MRVCVLIAAAALISTACFRQGDPSVAFEQAQAEFNALYGRHLEDAYLMEEMDAIETKLAEVPESSSDYNRAQHLLMRIRSGRERQQARIAEREAAIAQARAPAPDVPFSGTPAAPQDAGTAQAEAPDAGVPGPVAGMPVSELTRRWSECFLPGLPVDVPQRGTLRTFDLRDTAYCRQQHPGYDQKVVVVEAGKVLFVGDRSKIEIVREDAGVR